MLEIKGKDIKIFASSIEEEAIKQIKTLLNQPAFADCKIRIMPDCHAGAGCVIGYTAIGGGSSQEILR